MKTCSICESQNEPESTECLLCGAPFAEPEPAPPALPPAPPEPSSGSLNATDATGSATMFGPPPSMLSPSGTQPAPRPVPPFDPFKTHSRDEPTPVSIPLNNPTVQEAVQSTPWSGTVPAPGPAISQFSGMIGPADQSAPSPPVSNITRPPDPYPAPPSNSNPPNTPIEVPPPGTLCLIVYYKRRPALYFPVVYDEILIGRTDPASNAYPDLDVTPFDPDLAISRKHSYLLRESNQYYIYPISNSGTQVNQEMVDIGTKRLLTEGDVVILSGRLALRFSRVPG